MTPLQLCIAAEKYSVVPTLVEAVPGLGLHLQAWWPGGENKGKSLLHMLAQAAARTQQPGDAGPVTSLSLYLARYRHPSTGRPCCAPGDTTGDTTLLHALCSLGCVAVVQYWADNGLIPSSLVPWPLPITAPGHHMPSALLVPAGQQAKVVHVLPQGTQGREEIVPGYCLNLRAHAHIAEEVDSDYDSPWDEEPSAGTAAVAVSTSAGAIMEGVLATAMDRYGDMYRSAHPTLCM